MRGNQGASPRIKGPLRKITGYQRNGSKMGERGGVQYELECGHLKTVPRSIQLGNAKKPETTRCSSCAE